jgi:hypothetical protein
MERIKGQFIAGRRQEAGASDMLRLYIQRPRVWKHKKFALQREDVHDKKYAAEFVVEIPMGDIMEEKRKATFTAKVRSYDVRKYSAEFLEKYAAEIVDDLMGWKLGMKRKEEWMPATIRRVERHGALAMWNEKHQDQLILEGDEILKVDKVIWQHNSTTFLKNLKRHFKSSLATDARNNSWSVVLSIRRPRTVQAAFDKAHPVQEIVPSSGPSTNVALRFNRTGETNRVGWKLSPSTSGVDGKVLVEEVRETGLVADWNAENPNKTILPSDHIVALNDITWDRYDSPQEFYDAVQTALTAASHAGPAGDAVRLTLERPVQKSVKQFRRGYHHVSRAMLQVGAYVTPPRLPPLATTGLV